MRIMIIGFSGAGKSTLARILGEHFSIEPVHLDSVYWLPDWKDREREEMKRIVGDIIKEENWIIDGTYSYAYLNERAERADMIIFLDFNRFLCLYRVIKRYFMYKGKTRPDMGEGCSEKLDFEFIKWVFYESRKRKKRKKRYELIRNAEKNGKKVYILKSPEGVRKFLKDLGVM